MLFRSQLNCVAAVLLLPAASVNAPAATSTVTSTPSDVGVRVAVYTVDEVALKEDSVALVTLMSPTTKSVVASLDVNVIDRVESSELAPSEASAEVIVIVGPVESSLFNDTVLLDCEVLAALSAPS